MLPLVTSGERHAGKRETMDSCLSELTLGYMSKVHVPRGSPGQNLQISSCFLSLPHHHPFGWWPAPWTCPTPPFSPSAPSTASWEPEGEEFKVFTHKNSATRKGPLKQRMTLKEGEAVGYVDGERRGWRRP